MGLLASAIGAAANREKHERANRATLRELPRVGSPGLELLPSGLSLRWLGTAGFVLSYEGITVLIDPYVTRLSLGDLLRGRVVHSSGEALSRWVPAADAVLVGHTHFDHALDVPVIAGRDGCPVYGGTAMARLMTLHGLQHQAVVVQPYEVEEIGPFPCGSSLAPTASSSWDGGCRPRGRSPVISWTGWSPGPFAADRCGVST